ncbi:hypothetical protein [Massilia aerilata]|uniref:Uncharacterized protein n=1 Tax=Massilia aerilata TaxID=453817 RepID=A0ABW0RVZ0_9BURK
MSRKPPPVSDADRWELSRAMLALAEQAEEIRDELTAQGYDRPGAIVREAQLALADRVASRQGLLDYWREYAKEDLSALDSPIDILRGHYAAPWGYRSALIADLRSKAHLLPAGELIQSPQIEPAFKAWLETVFEPGTPQHDAWLAGLEARRQAVASSGEPERPEFAALDTRVRMALLRERYMRTLAPAGFRLVAPSRRFSHFQRLAANGKYVFSLLDDSFAKGAWGKLRCRFAITWPGTGITSADLFPIRLSAFDPGVVVPDFQYSTGYRRDSWGEFCLAIDTVACLTAILFRRLDAALQDRSI